MFLTFISVFIWQGTPEEEHTDSAMASEGEEGEGDDDKKEEEEEKAKPQVAPLSQPLLIGSSSGFIETTVKIKQNDMLPGPKVHEALSCTPRNAKTQLLSQADFSLFSFSPILSWSWMGKWAVSTCCCLLIK